MNREWKIFAAFLAVFLFAYFVPLATPTFSADASPAAAKVTGAIVEAFVLLQWYARTYGTFFPSSPTDLPATSAVADIPVSPSIPIQL